MPVERPECGVQGIVVGIAGTVICEDSRRLAGGEPRTLAARNSPAQSPAAGLAESRPQLEHLRLSDEVVHVRVLDHGRRAASRALAEGRVRSAERRFKEGLHWNIVVP